MLSDDIQSTPRRIGSTFQREINMSCIELLALEDSLQSYSAYFELVRCVK
jgi:hypothetical protein